MKTSPHCIPCFMRQAKYAAALATSSETLQVTIFARSAALINSFDRDLSPPENAVLLYRMIAELSGTPDIFHNLKKAGNRKVLGMRDKLAQIISQSPAPFETAARLAIAGNIIDYGALQKFAISQTIRNTLSDDLAINDLESLRNDLEKARAILYLGDNCGELVFDRLFIENIGKPTTFAVKERPVINDATLEDAKECGLDKVCRLITNGTDCPGTPLAVCSTEFKNAFREADLIISKGQGNFETLSETPGPIYFLLMVKCPVVAEHINERRPTVSEKEVLTGDMVALKHRLYGSKRG